MLTSTMAGPQINIANTFTPPHQTMMACLIGRVGFICRSQPSSFFYDAVML
ncbi:hypothetical protein ACB035_15900 [Aeromonas sp. S12(2024)]|uniref:hypothetical protein n=1 Tax=Aeromonas sp. S12(2024) TaxID=3242885 RepID=UPI003529D369